MCSGLLHVHDVVIFQCCTMLYFLVSSTINFCGKFLQPKILYFTKQFVSIFFEKFSFVIHQQLGKEVLEDIGSRDAVNMSPM